MANNISITGVQALLKDIDKFEAKTKALLQAEIKASVQTIVRNAKRALSTNKTNDMGALTGGIGYKKVNPTLYEYFSQLEYSQYVEFGTKRRRKIPPEVQKLGYHLTGGKGTGIAAQALKFITAWTKRKGIRFESAATVKSGKSKGSNRKLTFEQTAYIIFHYIMLVGIRPQPFYFPSLLAEIPVLENRLKMIVNSATV